MSTLLVIFLIVAILAMSPYLVPALPLIVVSLVGLAYTFFVMFAVTLSALRDWFSGLFRRGK